MRRSKLVVMAACTASSVMAMATLVPLAAAPAGASTGRVKVLSAEKAGGFHVNLPFLAGVSGATGATGVTGVSGATGSTGATGSFGSGDHGARGHAGWDDDSYGLGSATSGPVVTWESQFEWTVSGVVDLRARISRLGFSS